MRKREGQKVKVAPLMGKREGARSKSGSPNGKREGQEVNVAPLMGKIEGTRSKNDSPNGKEGGGKK